VNKKTLLVALTIFALLQTGELWAESIRHQIAQRRARIETLKQHGLVYEKPGGFLESSSHNPDIINFVKKENVDRQARHAVLLEQQCLEKWPDSYRMRLLCYQEDLRRKQ
jgi:hypothetical protein